MEADNPGIELSQYNSVELSIIHVHSGISNAHCSLDFPQGRSTMYPLIYVLPARHAERPGRGYSF